jgi:hypothetical protein
MQLWLCGICLPIPEPAAPAPPCCPSHRRRCTTWRRWCHTRRMRTCCSALVLCRCCTADMAPPLHFGMLSHFCYLFCRILCKPADTWKGLEARCTASLLATDSALSAWPAGHATTPPPPPAWRPAACVYGSSGWDRRLLAASRAARLCWQPPAAPPSWLPPPRRRPQWQRPGTALWSLVAGTTCRAILLCSPRHPPPHPSIL